MYSFTKFCTVYVLLQIVQASSSDCELKISYLVQSLQGCANAHSQQCDDTKQPAPLPSSCQDIYTKWTNSPSGFYQIGDKSSSSPAYVYCNMDELCGSKGGWTRQAYLDMSDSSSTCPAGFKLYQSDGVRACGRHSYFGSCQSVKFNTYGNYSQVCGKVIGYQYEAPDAVYLGRYKNEKYGSLVDSHHNDINSYYVDGVSITHGYPRQHIWTLIAGLTEASFYLDGRYNCPFSNGSLQNTSIQTFVGNDYFCESGNPSTTGQFSKKLYTKDPLWDGKGCGILETNICSNKGQPWFNKKLSNVTNDYIELRVCDDETIGNEDNPVTYYEIYTK